MTVHVLTQGCGYDIDGRKPTWQRPDGRRSVAVIQPVPANDARTETPKAEDRR
jgi:hypothetical protein